MSTNIVVPELGESVVEARVAKWLKKQGDAVSAGDALVELETEKIDLEVSADRAGVLRDIKHKEGADVKVGEVLAVLEDASPNGSEAEVPKVPSVPEVPKGVVPRVPVPSAAATERKATPTAKNVAKAHDVKLESVASNGPRVTKQDVLKAKAPAPSAPAPQAPTPAPQAPLAPKAPVASGARSETRERMSKRRATIARRLVEAQHTAAMLTTFNEVDMSAVMSLRERRKEAFTRKYGVSVGIAQHGDDEAAFGSDRHADQMTFAAIELAIRDVAKRAGDGTLTLDDLKGGTFTITNGGVFGSLMSTPILNPPQVGILGLHKIADRAVAINGQVVIRPMMYVALSYDHRLVDGREAVQFLVKIKEFIEDPAWMLLES